MGLRIGRFTVALWLCMCLAAAQVAIAEPLPADADIPTRADYEAQVVKLHIRAGADAYREHGVRDAKWDEEAVKFLEMFARWDTHEHGRPTNEQLHAAGKEAIDLGCDDPLVQCCFGWALNGIGESNAAARLVQSNLKALMDSAYDPAWKGRAALSVSRYASALGRDKDEHQLILLALRQYAAMTQGKTVYAENPVVLFHLIETRYLDAVKFDYRVQYFIFLNQAEGVDPWVKNMLSGAYFIHEAWHHRGNGMADTVTPKGLEGYRRNLNNAAHVLVAAHKAHPERPEAAAMMIKLAQDGAAGGTSTRFWFDEAVKAQIDYPPAYQSYLWSLRPRWNGSLEELHAFGVECLRTGRFDTMVPMVFFEALKDIGSEMGNDYEAAFKKFHIHDDLQKMIAGYIDRPEMQSYAPWLESLRIAAAWRDGRYETARDFLEAAKHPLDDRAFHDFDVRHARVVPEIYARIGNWKPETDKLMAMKRALAFDKFITRANELAELAQAQGSPAASYYANEAVRMRYDRDLPSGKWVSIQPDDGLHMWVPMYGQWEVDKEGGLIGRSGIRGLMIMPEYAFGEALEVAGRIEFIESPDDRVNAGVMLVGVQTQWHLSTLFHPERGKVTMQANWTLPRGSNVEMKLESPVTFLFRWDGRSVQLDAQGKRIMPAVPHGRLEVHPDGHLALGGHVWFEGVTVRYTDLRVRRIKKR